MTIDILFGKQAKRKKAKPLRLKVIKPVFETLKISEEAALYLDSNEPLSSSASVAGLLSFLNKETKEHFLALHLDSKNRLLCLEIVSVGSLNASIVHPREVFKSALLSSAAALIIAHNHPSGNSQPSREDIELTARLKQGSELLGIRLLDHIILGDRPYSFADNGLI
jgi:DNA repair protein RadC